MNIIIKIPLSSQKILRVTNTFTCNQNFGGSSVGHLGVDIPAQF